MYLQHHEHCTKFVDFALYGFRTAVYVTGSVVFRRF